MYMVDVQSFTYNYSLSDHSKLKWCWTKRLTIHAWSYGHCNAPYSHITKIRGLGSASLQVHFNCPTHPSISLHLCHFWPLLPCASLPPGDLHHLLAPMLTKHTQLSFRATIKGKKKRSPWAVMQQSIPLQRVPGWGWLCIVEENTKTQQTKQPRCLFTKTSLVQTEFLSWKKKSTKSSPWTAAHCKAQPRPIPASGLGMSH